MKTQRSISMLVQLAAVIACLIATATIIAQSAPGERGPGGGGRGGPPLSPEEMTALNNFNSKLAAEATAVSVASSNLVAITFTIPKDEAKIAAANTALAKAREAWAKKASEEFAKIQASPNKLSDAAIARLIASAPGGGRGGGGFGGPRERGDRPPRPQ